MIYIYIYVYGWLYIFHRLGIIIPTDFHIFQRGRYTTNQIYPCIRPMFQGYVSGNTSSKDGPKNGGSGGSKLRIYVYETGQGSLRKLDIAGKCGI